MAILNDPWTYPDQLSHPSGVMLTREPAFALIALRETPSQESGDVLKGLESILDQYELERVGQGDWSVTDLGTGRQTPTHSMVNDTSRMLWVQRSALRAITPEAVLAVSGSLRDLDYVGPVYRTPGTRGLRGLLCPVPNVLLLRAHRTKQGAFDKLLATLPVDEVPEQSKLLQGIGLHHLRVRSLEETTAYQLRDDLLEEHDDVVATALLKHIPLRKASLYTPTDVLFPEQWNLKTIGADLAWDISKGSVKGCICVVDDGFELDHPDLKDNLVSPGIDIGNPSRTAKNRNQDEYHGTRVASVAAARMDNNAEGMAGVAGTGTIYPIKFDQSDVECAAAITHAADWTDGSGTHVRVINFSFGWEEGALSGINTGLIDEAIAYAYGKGCVLCAGTGNGGGADSSKNLYPSRHPLVIACGGSDKADQRWSDLYFFNAESHFGMDTHNGVLTGVSVVAPAVGIRCASLGGVYDTDAGTSYSTPQVSGVAALLLSMYGLTNTRVREVIERTAEKVGTYEYLDDPAFPNGTRHPEMGYGRVNAHRALDFADVFIKDWPGDDGREPSSPPDDNFWCSSDIVVRSKDDDDFRPHDPAEASQVSAGKENWIYVRVTNGGPAVARNVRVRVRIVPWTGVGFTYPEDWTLTDSNHIEPTPVIDTFAAIPASGSQIAKFKISAAQTDSLWGWADGAKWHPCILAEARADNDYAWETASTTGARLFTRRNNLAQRNLTVLPAPAGGPATFSFVLGQEFFTRSDHRLVIVLSALPRQIPVALLLDVLDDRFPRLESAGLIIRSGITHVWTDVGSVREDPRGRIVELRWPQTEVRMRATPRGFHQLVLGALIPTDAQPGEPYRIDVRGEDSGTTVVWLVSPPRPQ